MPTPDQLIARIAERQHGVFSRDQAIHCGLSQDQIDRRVAGGRWQRVHRGVYRIAGCKLTFEGRVLAGVLSVGRGAVAAGATAGTLWEFEGVRSPWIQVVTAAGRRPAAPRGLRVRRSRTLRREDVTTFRFIPITTVSRTLMDLAAELAEGALEDALDSALRRKRANAEQLLDAVRNRRDHGVTGLALLERLLVVRVGLEPSGSGKENRLRRFLEATGLPTPVAQYTVRRTDGSFVGRVDFAYPEAKIVLEFDSYEWHSSRNDWEDDLVRQNQLVEVGWFPVRVTDRQMDEVPDDVLRVIWRRLAAAAAVSSPQMGSSS